MAGVMIRGYRFEGPASKDGLLTALEAIDLEDVGVEETAGGQDIVVRTAWDLPPRLWMDGVEGCLVQQAAGAPGEQPVVVWFSPPFPVDSGATAANPSHGSTSSFPGPRRPSGRALPNPAWLLPAPAPPGRSLDPPYLEQVPERHCHSETGQIRQ